MLGLLRPAHYTDPQILVREQARIFDRLWIFAGLAQFVAEPDQYFTRRIGSRDVVVQNFDGTLHAYENLCRHRGKRLQTESFGRRPLVCGYHGWRYAADGAVAVVPFESDCYRLDPVLRAGLRLPEFSLRQIGALLFINVSDTPIALEEQFDPALLATITSVSDSFDDDVMVTTVSGHYNWKLAYENLRDSLHPRFVHTRTLNVEVDFGGGVSEALVAMERGGQELDLRQLSFGGAEGRFRQPRRVPFHDLVQRWGNDDAYYNWLLYPNTHIVSPDGGYLFSIEHHEPIAADRTLLTLYFMTAKRRGTFAGTSTVLWEYANGAKPILDEDRAIMEETQAGLASPTAAIAQGQFELQSRMTDRWYLHQLG